MKLSLFGVGVLLWLRHVEDLMLDSKVLDEFILFDFLS